MTTPTPPTAPQAGPEGTPPAAPETKPPWADGTFDPEKAWKLVQDLRADKEQLSKRPVLDDDAKRKLAEYDRLEQASKSDLQRATEEATRWQAEADRWRTTSVASKIQALAATDFADPTDAVNALDPAKYLDAGGVINEDLIRADLVEVLTRKPHYRRADGTPPTGPRTPAPNPAQGAGGGAAAAPRDQFAALLQGQMNGSR